MWQITEFNSRLVKEGVECIGPDVESIKTAVTDQRNAQTRDRISRWLSPSDPATNLEQALARRNEHTGSWFLDSKLLAKWKKGELQHLWLHGLSGSGKTILSAALIQDLITNNTLDTPPTLMFFFDFSVAEKQTLDSLLKSLIWQLFNIGDDAAGYLNKLFESNRNGLTQPNITGLWDCLVSMTREIGRVNIVIDALDECSTRNELVSWIEGVAARPRLPEIHMIRTGRPEYVFVSWITPALGGEHCMALEEETVDEDILSYVNTRLKRDREFTTGIVSRRIDLQEGIRNKVGRRAKGM